MQRGRVKPHHIPKHILCKMLSILECKANTIHERAKAITSFITTDDYQSHFERFPVVLYALACSSLALQSVHVSGKWFINTDSHSNTKTCGHSCQSRGHHLVRWLFVAGLPLWFLTSTQSQVSAERPNYSWRMWSHDNSRCSPPYKCAVAFSRGQTRGEFPLYRLKRPRTFSISMTEAVVDMAQMASEWPALEEGRAELLGLLEWNVME